MFFEQLGRGGIVPEIAKIGEAIAGKKRKSFHRAFRFSGKRI
jgi:hypothetical protein